MPPAEFEPATPTIQWPQTYALDHMDNKIDRYLLLDVLLLLLLLYFCLDGFCKYQ
jgi:hypothetical protein